MSSIQASGTNSDKGVEAWIYYPGQILNAWEDLEPLIEKAVSTTHGETTLEDIKNLLLRNVITAFALAKDKEIQLLLLVEFISWPQYKAARIIGLAGKGLIEARPFRSMFEAWCLAQGAVEIEAWTQPEMSRVLLQLGFFKTYEVVRLDLRSKLQ